MRRKTPEDVFFGPNCSQIQSVAVDILKLAYLAIFNQLFDLSDSGMKKEKMANHQVNTVIFGKLLEISCFFCLERKWFFDKNMPFVVYDKFCYLEMSFGRGRHCEPIKILSYRIFDVRIGLYIRILFLAFGTCIRLGFNNTGQKTELAQCPYVIFAPAAGSDDTNIFIHRMLL